MAPFWLRSAGCCPCLGERWIRPPTQGSGPQSPSPPPVGSRAVARSDGGERPCRARRSIGAAGKAHRCGNPADRGSGPGPQQGWIRGCGERKEAVESTAKGWWSFIGQPALDGTAGTHSMTSAPTGRKAMASVGSPAIGSSASSRSARDRRCCTGRIITPPSKTESSTA